MKNNLTKILRLFWIFLISIFTNQSLASSGSSTIVDLNNHEANFKLLQCLSESESKSSNGLLHVFTHGKPGELLIDGAWKNPVEIANYLKSKVTPEITKVNIYGCEFAKGSIGKKAVELLESKLNVSISASDDITGIDGDWDLEVGHNNGTIALSNFASNLQCATGLNYKVYAYWRTIVTSCNAVNYVVSHGSTQIVTNVNQGLRPSDVSYAGYDWQLIGSNVVPNSSGSFSIKLRPGVSTCTVGNIVADAILIVDNLGNHYIIDNSNGSKVGNWTNANGSFTLDYDGTMDYMVRSSAASGDYYEWIFKESEQLGDNDKDGILDICDYDDDNDGILDSQEDFNIVCSPSNLGIEYYSTGAAFPNFGTNQAPITDYFTTSQNGLPWFPANRLPASPTTVPTSNVSPPNTSSTVGELIIRDYTLNFGCQSNVKFQLRSTSTWDYNALYMSAGGPISNATQVAYLASGQLNSAFTAPANPSNGLIYLRHYLADDNSLADGQIYWSSDQQTTPLLLEATTLPCGDAICQHKDSDGDGIPDYLDTDSDNDGCSDAIEGGKVMTVKNVNSSQKLTGNVDANGVPLIIGASGQSIGTSTNATVQDPECNPCNSASTLFIDKDLDGIANDCDIDDDNDGITDIDEGICYATGTYNLDVNATLASLTVQPNGGSFNLKYVLSSGTAVPSIGNTFNVPFYYSDLINTATTQDHQWEGVNLFTPNAASGSEYKPALAIRMKVSLLNTNLPVNNSTAEVIPIGNNPDVHFRNMLKYGQIDQLGNYTTYIGALPITSLSTIVNESIQYYSVFNYGGTATILNGGFYARPQFADPYPYNLGYAQSGILTTSHTELVKWIYSAFSDGNSGFVTNGTNRGAINLQNGVITYCISRDTDGDGIPDYLDVDSDNDGCPDAIEGDSSIVYSNLTSTNMLKGTVYPSGLSTQFTSSTIGQGIGTSIDSLHISQACVTPDSTTVPAPSIVGTIFKICAIKNQLKGKLTYVSCGVAPGTYAASTIDSNGCINYTSNPSLTDTINTCIVTIDEKGIRDSTIIKILPSIKFADIKVSPLQADILDCQVNLNWTMFSTENASHIEIQRSEDLSNFTTIGRIEVPANSSLEQKMQYIDRIIDYGNKKYYYRLKLVDLDNSFDYSETILLNSSCGTERQIGITVSPNPGHDKYQAIISGLNLGLGKLTILNSMGQIIASQVLDINQNLIAINFDLSEYSDGVYILTVQDAKGSVEHVSLIKN